MEKYKYYYIRGNAEHPEKVKEALERAYSKIATTNNQSFKNKNALYYVEDECVCFERTDSFFGKMLLDFGTELFIEPDYKFKVGDKVTLSGHNKVIARVTEQVNKQGYAYYKVQATIEYLRPESDLQLYTEPKPQFEPFQKVLGLDLDRIWSADFYSHYDNTSDFQYRCVGGNYRECIPYEGNEYLLGTTDSPK